MDELVNALALRYEQGAALATPRACAIDPSGAPDAFQRLVNAMIHHSWDVALGDYSLDGADDEAVRGLDTVLELLDLDDPMEVAMAQAGAAGGPFDPSRSVLLGADGGGMTQLGVSWADGTLGLVVVEFEEDPNQDGLLKHLVTPGAALGYLEQYLRPEVGPDLVALREAVAAAGCDLTPAAPILSRTPAEAATPAAPVPAAEPPGEVFAIGTRLEAAMKAHDLDGVRAQLSRLDGLLVNGSLKVPVAVKALWNHREAAPEEAFLVALWLLDQPAPIDLMVRREWLNGLIFATEVCLGVSHPRRGEVIERCLAHLEECPDVCYKAARFHASQGDPDRALGLIERSARTSYPHLADLVAHTELDALRASGALDQALARGRAGA